MQQQLRGRGLRVQAAGAVPQPRGEEQLGGRHQLRDQETQVSR